MRGAINDSLRWLIRLGTLCFGFTRLFVERTRMVTFFWNQKRLRKRYGITPLTPILSYGPKLEQLISDASRRADQDQRFAFTSGSTAHPKRILYTRKRLRAVKLAYIDMFARCCWSLRLKQTSLYVFSSLDRDDSLTSLLLEEKGCPPYLSSLQAPYRLNFNPAVQFLVSVYGPTAVRLWLLTISNPAVFYCTNPSTLSIFLDELTADWQRSSQLIRDWCRQPEKFNKEVQKIARRLDSHGSATRLKLIAQSAVPLPLKSCVPAFKTYICWTGGYVKPFVTRLTNYLSPNHYRLVPMCSMSTESIETVSHFDDGKVSFLPLAPGVVYEFIEEGREDDPGNLLPANELEVGKNYAMVVSDNYGLRRYQTGDLFQCKGFVGRLPDLHFVGRRDLEYSFTGEKLTSEQVSAAFQNLRELYPQLGPDVFLSCLPSQPADDPIPHYKTVIMDGTGEIVPVPRDELAERCDQLFSKANCEYRNKRESGRLGPVRVVQMSPIDLIQRTRGLRKRNGWESQFKFLPLYRNTWEAFDNLVDSATRIDTT